MMKRKTAEMTRITKTGKLAKPTKKPKAKRKSIPNNIRDRAMYLFQRLRKLQECQGGFCTCISCGKVMPLDEAQGGHYIPRANRATEMEHDNIWPQCGRCNGFLNGNPIDYRYNLVNRIGEERVLRIEAMARAFKGDEEALASLNEDDREKVTMKRPKSYYMSEFSRLNNIVKEIENGKGYY